MSSYGISHCCICWKCKNVRWYALVSRCWCGVEWLQVPHVLWSWDSNYTKIQSHVTDCHLKSANDSCPHSQNSLKYQTVCNQEYNPHNFHHQKPPSQSHFVLLLLRLPLPGLVHTSLPLCGRYDVKIELKLNVIISIFHNTLTLMIEVETAIQIFQGFIKRKPIECRLNDVFSVRKYQIMFFDSIFSHSEVRQDETSFWLTATLKKYA